MGHGVRAALITDDGARWNTHSVEAPEPGRLLTQLNSESWDFETDRHACFVTVLYCVINIKQAPRVSRARAPTAVAGATKFRRSADDPSWARIRGPAMGIIRNTQFKTTRNETCAGDFLLFYTDGIIEVEAGTQPVWR